MSVLRGGPRVRSAVTTRRALSAACVRTDTCWPMMAYTAATSTSANRIPTFALTIASARIPLALMSANA